MLPLLDVGTGLLLFPLDDFLDFLDEEDCSVADLFRLAGFDFDFDFDFFLPDPAPFDCGADVCPLA